jgi:hypothetical protein
MYGVHSLTFVGAVESAMRALAAIAAANHATRPRPNSNGSGPQGQIWLHRAATDATLGTFQIPRVQPEDQYSSAHMVNALTDEGYRFGRRLVQRWDHRGRSRRPVGHTRDPLLRRARLEAADIHGIWSAYGYDGFVCSDGLRLGLDSLFLPRPELGRSICPA